MTVRARIASALRHGALSVTLLGACAGALQTASCAAVRDDASEHQSEARLTLDKADWLEKAARLLRNGHGLGPDDDVAALLATSEDRIVDRWMQDPRFADTVLGFNLYFLGVPVTSLKQLQGGSPPRLVYDRTPFDWPQAFDAARAVNAGGDYFDLFSGAPRLTARSGSIGMVGVLADPIWERRRATLLGKFDEAIAMTVRRPREGCTTFVRAVTDVSRDLARYNLHLDSKVLESWTTPSTTFPDTVNCQDIPPVPANALADKMRTVRAAVEAVFVAAESVSVPAAAEYFTEIPPIDVAVAGLPPIADPFGPALFARSPRRSRGFWDNVPVGSTNFQRKRASYVLKTYFCDDLTPASLPDVGADAGGDVHAENAACQSCHYRLDPIGALFRYRGKGGIDESGLGKITFDDDVVLAGDEFQRYLDTWRNPDGSFRAGYYVMGADGHARRDPEWLPEYGDELSGLFAYMRRSELVRSCVVRRLAEYVLGPGQVYDRDWLREVSKDFRSGPDSGEAFKQVVKRLVLSKTFATHDPRPGECYDLPSDAPPNRAPCVVASIVANQCVSCHRSPSGPGHLDFTRWIPLPDGTFSWAHTDGGAQLPRRETLRRILDRITTPDRDKRMPLLRTLPVEEAVTLRGWLEESLESTTP